MMVMVVVVVEAGNGVGKEGIGLVGLGGMVVYAFALWVVFALTRCGNFLRVANFNGEWRGVCVFQ